MLTGSTKASRGRPKTLNRDHLLEVAMLAYWQGGPECVSINEICKIAKVSKPGLYREFGSEDELMKAVILAYEKNVLKQLLEVLTTDTPFRETLDNIVTFTTTEDANRETPVGCLMVKMRESRQRMGDATKKQIDKTQEVILTVYKNWVEHSKAKGEFAANMSSQFAAIYILVQISNALSLLARGEPNDTVKAILKTAFSVLV